MAKRAWLWVLLWGVMVLTNGCRTPRNQHVVYKIKVEAGDTLAQIAQKYDTTWQSIAQLNGLGPHPKIARGQVLKVKPGPGGIVAKSQKVGRSLPNQPAATEEQVEGATPDRDRQKRGLLFQGADANRFLWPAKGRITSGYGWRWGRMHRGVDIRGKRHSSFRSAGKGVVTFVGWKRGYGKTIIVKHNDRYESVYAHCQKILVSRGEHVAMQSRIGTIGSTGRATGPHLHFEIRRLGKAINPMPYLRHGRRIASFIESLLPSPS